MSKNARLGIGFFFVYAVVYATFVLTSAFVPSVMDWTPLAGVNLAVWSGTGLIVLAFVMSIVYGVLCKSDIPSQSE